MGRTVRGIFRAVALAVAVVSAAFGALWGVARLGRRSPAAARHPARRRLPAPSVTGMETESPPQGERRAEPLAPAAPLRSPAVLATCGLTALLVTAVAANLFYWGTWRTSEAPRWQMPDADPVLGRQAIVNYGCGGCHVIPGVPGAAGRVGPQLVGLRNQSYIAGRLPNLPENLALWIHNPQDVDPHTAMPNLSVPPDVARHMAAYLYGTP